MSESRAQVDDTVTRQFALQLEYLLGDFYYWAANVSASNMAYIIEREDRHNVEHLLLVAILLPGWKRDLLSLL